VNCLNPIISGITTDGGYAEMIAEARALASIPDELSSEEAAPREASKKETNVAVFFAAPSAEAYSSRMTAAFFCSSAVFG